MIFYIFAVVEDSSLAPRVFFFCFFELVTRTGVKRICWGLFSVTALVQAVYLEGTLEEMRHLVQLCDSFICFS